MTASTTAKTAANPSKEKAVLEARKRKQTPSVFKLRNRRNTPIVFSLDDVKEILDKRRTAAEEEKREQATKKATTKKATIDADMPQESRVLGAASLADILGFNPAAGRGADMEEASVPAKFKKYFKALTELRDRVREGLSLHTSETLRKSSKEESGDLSGYGQHMADAGSDSAERDFALSLVSNEQELLYEIEEALKRIREGTYGVCEITGVPIDKERLMAVPFTRYSLEGQRELESNRRRSRSAVGGGIFSDASEESSLTEDEGDS
ncbi:MAG: TraR/DksA family transcriptional regulator [Opitutales bacterium]